MEHHVTLQPSGHRFPVGDGEAILAAGLRAGFLMPYSCKTGVCRTCRGRVVQGRVDFGNVHPHYLTEANKAEGLALLCQARPLDDVVVEVDEIALHAIPAREIPCRVQKLNRVSRDVIVLSLRLPLNENMQFAAGQYVDLLVDGARRSYSIATQPTPEGTIDVELHIRHVPGGRFTDRLFAGAIKERTLLRFVGPQGTFFLREDSPQPAIFLASGTGFAPIKAMLEHAFARGLNRRRPMTLYWGCRSLADLYMLETPMRWQLEQENFRFVPVLSEPLPGDGWTGRTGFVHRAVMDDHPDLSGHQVYACGAPAMVDAARAEFTTSRQLPEREFYADSFLTEADRQPH